MSSDPKRRHPAVYQDIVETPDTMVSELVDGQIYTRPRPSFRHARASDDLANQVQRAYSVGSLDGPGGWWLLHEPELHFGAPDPVLVPDWAGWRAKRLPDIGGLVATDVAPDWVCELLSPSTHRYDREVKMPIYAKYGVAFVWLVDPTAKALEAYELEQGKWHEIARHQGEPNVRVAPFEAVELRLSQVFRTSL